MSEYGKIFSKFGLLSNNSIFNRPNAEYGIGYYLFVWILKRYSMSYSRSVRERKYLIYLLLLITLCGILLSVVLGYVMVTILKNLCIICIGTYVCNLFIFVATLVTYFESKKRND